MKSNFYSSKNRSRLLCFAVSFIVFSFFGGTSAFAQCVPQFSNSCSSGDQILNFETTGGTTNISNFTNGCNGGNYMYFPGMTVTLAPGGTFNFTVQSGPTWSQGHKIWIDLNNDQDFTDPGEDVWTGTIWTTAPVTGSVTIPIGTSPGIKRMRVRCSYNSIPTDPCANQTFGEAEDYDVNVSVPYPNDAGILSLDAPSAPICVLNDSIWVTLKNYGTDTLTSTTIKYSYNGGAPVSFAWTGNLAPDSTEGPMFIGATSMISGNSLDVWTELPNGMTDSAAYNDSIVSTVPALSMNGTYTVGVGQNFNTIQDAVDELHTLGVCGPVIFNISAGTYDEQVEINDIVGTSATNNIIFQSVAMDSTTVIFTTSTGGNTSNWTLNMNGADWVTFRHMTIENTSTTYARAINVEGESNNNSFTNNVIRNDNATTTSNLSAVVFSSGSQDHGNAFKWNLFENGSYSMYWRGSGQTILESNTVIEGNTFSNPYWYGISIYYQDGMTIHNNRFESTSLYTGTSYAISNWYCHNGTKITNNVIKPSGNRWPVYGIQHYYNDNTSTNRGLVANNCVRNGDSLILTTTFYGFYGFNNGFLDVVNNTFDIAGGSTASRCIYSSGGGINTVTNNNLSNFGQGYSVYFQDDYTVVESNNNNLFTTGNNFAWRGGITYSNLAAWQAGSGFDLNGVSVDPGFVTFDDCKLCQDDLDGAAALNGLITEDYEGNVRSLVSPDIGASEFVGIGNFTLGNDPTFCDGSGILEAGPAQTILWSTGEITSSIVVTTPGAYSVSINTVCGAASDTANVTVLSPPALASMLHICADETVDLDATVGGTPTYSWSTGHSSAVYTASSSGQYTVTVTSGACEYIEAVDVSQSQAVSLPDEASACDGDAITLDATILDGVVYTWTPSFSGPVNTVNTSDEYIVVVTDVFGCVSSDSVQVTMVTDPASSFVSAFSFLTGSFTNTTPGTGGNEVYHWDFGDGTTSGLENPVHVFPWTSSPQIYLVTLTVTNECGTSTTTQEVSISTGINDPLSGNSFQLYPNPNDGNFTIQMNNANYANAVIDVVDLQGRTISTYDLGAVRGEVIQQIQLEDFAKGTYIVRLTLDNTIEVRRVSIM